MVFDRLKRVASLSLCWVLSCAELPDIERLVCGNSLVEPEVGEACDTFATGTGDRGLPTSCGKAGTSAACLFVHDDAHDCPAGYGAGRDGVCRRPLGTFGAETSRIDAEGTVLRVADFDGDGVSDWMTTSPLAGEARVHLFTAGGALRESRGIPTSDTYFAPIIAELSAEAGPGQAADVVVANPRGLAVYEGAAKAFQTKAYATAPFPEGALPLAVPALANIGTLEDAMAPTLFTNELGALLDVAGGIEIRLLEPNVRVGLIANASLADVAGYTRTDLQPTPGFLLFPYDDFAFGIRSQTGPDRLVFLNPHENEAFRTTTTRPIAPPDAPAGSKLVAGPFGWTLNGVPRIAVVVEGADARGLLVYTSPTDPPSASYLLYDSGEPILAIASLVILGFVQVFVFVTPTGISIATEECRLNLPCLLEPTVLAPNPNLGSVFDGWTSAVFDPEVSLLYTASSRAAGIDAYRVDPNGGLAVLRIPTDRPVHTLARGDYDGDGALDTFAIMGEAEDACTSEDELLVLYGGESGFPEEITSLGELRGASTVSSGALFTPLFDGVDDLVVTTRCEGETRFGQFEGAASRNLISYYPVPGLGLGATDQSPLVAGRFGPDGNEDLAFFVGEEGGGPTSAIVGILTGSGEAQLTPGPAVSIPYADEDALFTAILLGRLAAGDANGDGIDDVAVCAPSFESVGVGLELTPACQVVLGGDAALTLAGSVVSSTSIATSPEVVFRATLSADWLDADDDGALDVAHGCRTDDDTSIAALFRGDGAGGLSELALILPEGERFAGIADAAEGIAEATVVVASETQVYGCRPNDDKTAIECEDVLLDFSEAGVVVLAVATAEMTGDGVTDLVVSTTGGTAIFPQLTWEP